MDRKEFKKIILPKVRRAITDYGMINSGDRLAVGISGGKDSGALLYILNEVRKTALVEYDLFAVFLDLGFGLDVNPLRDFCRRLGIPFICHETGIAQIVFDIRKEKNPCALCANLRRGALNEKALQIGCNKVVLGHHLDDVVHTFFMSLFYAGQLRTFSPNTFLDRTGLYMIRPLVYLDQKAIKDVAFFAGVPVINNPCPADGFTKREEMKVLVRKLTESYPDLTKKVLAALQGADLNNLWPKKNIP